MVASGCASAATVAVARSRVAPASTRATSGTSSSSSHARGDPTASKLGLRARGAEFARAGASGAIGRRRHVAAVATDGAVGDSSPSPSSFLESIPAMPPSQLEEKYLMGSAAEREHWFPVAFAGELDETTMIPFDLFNVPWVAFRDEKGLAGCIKDECAHRACPVSLGKLVDGKVQCPYHGWEYGTNGECVKMPSIKKLLPNVYVDAAPTVERDGLLCVWAGRWGADASASAASKLPDFAPPAGFAVMAEVTVEIPMDADEVLARLMAPGGRDAAAETVAFERVNVELSDDVFPKIVAGALRALRKPVPREVSFHPGRVIESTVGLEGGPGNWNIHQMHAVLPARPGRARVLFRISTDFVALPELARSIGGQVWANLAEMVLHEQLEQARPAGGGGEANAAAAASYEEWMREVSAN